MERRIFVLIFLLMVGNLAHCQERENLLFIKIENLLEKQEAALMKQEAALVKQEAALTQLKGMQEKLEHVEGKLQEIQENQDHTKSKLQEIQEKQEYVEGKVQEMQEKLQHVESNLQDIHHELGHMKGAVNSNQDSLQRIHQETKGCLGREDLEHLKDISSSRQQDLESSLRKEIFGVISLLETGGIDECSEGIHNCSDHASCIEKFVQFSCLCLPGFAGDGSHCEDIDECAQGKDECSPHATCRNSVGSYSCFCNPPFEGDGRTCEFQCRSPAKVLKGLGCVSLVGEKAFEGMSAKCHQDGWRLLQDFSHRSLQEVAVAFGYSGWVRWLGVHEGKWLESGLPVQEELWTEGSRGLDPSRRRGLCGFISWESSSSSYKVEQSDCSLKRYAYCQFVTPQK